MPKELPILPLRNTVLFPGVIFPISVGRPKSLKLIREVYQNNGVLGTVAQLDQDIDEPVFEDMYKVGTIAKILKILEMPDGNTTVIIQGKKRFEMESLTEMTPYIKANVKVLHDEKTNGKYS